MTTYGIESIIRNGNEYCFSGGGGGGPAIHFLKYIVVGGGAGGGFYGGGGGGDVKYSTQIGKGDSYTVTIGCGGAKGYYCGGCQPGVGGDSCLVGEMICVISKGGCIGVSCGCAGASGSGCAGYKGRESGGTGECTSANPESSGGGAGGAGQYCKTSDGKCGSVGGAGLCGYGGGGGGYYGYNLIWDNGGEGGGRGSHYSGNAQYPCNGQDATNCGGGGGAMYSTGMTNNYGGAGACGLVEVCYKCDGSDGIASATGGNCCFVCDGYCVHRFTSNGTFCITG